VFGLDFPFGLPRPLVKANTWEEFVRAFPGHYASAAEFREACRAVSRRPELKRVTDQETQTPLSVYNLRLFRQTFYGIRDVLRPLVQDQSACVLPMQQKLRGKPWLLEICPASTLKRLGECIGRKLYVPYKGKKPGRRQARAHILAVLGNSGHVAIDDRCLRVVIGDCVLRKRIVDECEGDALDSVIAALAVARALRCPDFPRPAWRPIYALEGYVYAL